jgi:type IV fimbrial biogenesis protein FimT
MRRNVNIKRARASSGFTILEILIAIVVLAIFLTLAVPSFISAIQNNRLTSATNGFLTAMQFARSEAISRRAPVSVCGSSDGLSCNDDWETGWIVFVDANDPGATTAVVDEVLRVWPSFAGEAENTGDDPNFVRFIANGAVDDAAGTAYPVEFTMQMPNCTRDNARSIEIERTGRVSAERVDCPS